MRTNNLPSRASGVILERSGVCMKKYGKFAALIVIVVGTLIWLATAGIKENQTYYKTIAELGQMGDKAYARRLRVAGDISTGSIVRKGNVVEFTLIQEKLNLKVAFDGTDPTYDKKASL